MRSGALMFTLVFLLALAMAAGAAVTRFEAEALTAPPTGADRTSAGFNVDSNPAESNGQMLYATLGGVDATFIFQGSGISWVGQGRADHCQVDWVVDEGLPSQVSGSFTPLTGGFQTVQTLVPAGTLDATALHTVRVEQGAGFILTIDAWDVDDAGSTITYVPEQPDLPPWYTYTSWAHNDPNAAGTGGVVSYTTVAGAAIHYEFTGNSIALLIGNREPANGGDFNWSIDGGALSGTASGRNSAFGDQHRTSRLLANTLGPGNHTLDITVSNIGLAAIFDGFFIVGTTVPAELSVLSSD